MLIKGSWSRDWARGGAQHRSLGGPPDSGLRTSICFKFPHPSLWRKVGAPGQVGSVIAGAGLMCEPSPSSPGQDGMQETRMALTSSRSTPATLLPLGTCFRSCICHRARAISWGPTCRSLLFRFMWFLRSKRKSADPCSSVIKKTPLLDPIPVNRNSI